MLCVHSKTLGVAAVVGQRERLRITQLVLCVQFTSPFIDTVQAALDVASPHIIRNHCSSWNIIKVFVF